MSNITFSELPIAAKVNPEDIIPIVQGGRNKQASVATLLHEAVPDTSTLEKRVERLEKLLEVDAEKGTSILDNAVFVYPVDEE